MAHPVRGNFAAALPKGETLESVTRKQVAFAAAQTGVTPAAFAASQRRAEGLRMAATQRALERSPTVQELTLGITPSRPTPKKEFVLSTKSPTIGSGPPQFQSLFGLPNPLDLIKKVIPKVLPFLPIPGAGLLPSLFPQQPKQFFGLPGGIPCIPPFFRNERTGECELDLVPGPGGGGVGPRRSAEFGSAVMGQFGVALEPAVDQIVVRDCPPGMLLGKDDLCYNRSQLRNKERKWPKGRRPLLTGGDLNAISKAKRAATRLDNAMKTSRAIGLLKPAPKKRR